MAEEKQPKASVLVVDDEPSIVGMLCEMLRSQGYGARGCTSGEKALEALAKDSFDAIISDLNMPGISGMGLLKQVFENHPHSAFVIVTGVGDTRIGIEAMKQGADDYLVKPFQLQGIVSSIERALEKRRLQRELDDYRRNLEEKVSQRTKQLEAAMRRIEMTYDETLEALGGALDLRDDETAGHSHRVTQYGLELAQAMACPNDQLTQIARGSYLHDIGKIGIPDSILLKPGKLTAQETAVMQTHVRIGYDLVRCISFLAPAAEIVLTHHERFDGTGYPQGLVAAEIPLGARIFVVADTLDAMTSDRPYRRALPYSAARKEIERESERQFDPEVVNVFLTIPGGVWENIRLQVANAQRRMRRSWPRSAPDGPMQARRSAASTRL